MKKEFILIVLVFAFSTVKAQNNSSWQVGFGASVVRFETKDANFIGDKHIFQTPRLNVTMPLRNKLSVDGALSFNTIDIGVITNTSKYFSADVSLRYNFNQLINNFYPYVFVGGSLVDSERKMTPTLNIGVGGTYWFAKNWGANTQLYYKHSLNSYESMRSHLQGSIGIVYNLDWGNLFGRGKGRLSCFN